MNSTRLSNLIQQRNSKKVTNYLLELYRDLNEIQKGAIKRDMFKIRNETLSN